MNSTVSSYHSVLSEGDATFLDAAFVSAKEVATANNAAPAPAGQEPTAASHRADPRPLEEAELPLEAVQNAAKEPVNDLKLCNTSERPKLKAKVLKKKENLENASEEPVNLKVDNIPERPKLKAVLKKKKKLENAPKAPVNDLKPGNIPDQPKLKAVVKKKEKLETPTDAEKPVDRPPLQAVDQNTDVLPKDNAPLPQPKVKPIIIRPEEPARPEAWWEVGDGRFSVWPCAKDELVHIGCMACIEDGRGGRPCRTNNLSEGMLCYRVRDLGYVQLCGKHTGMHASMENAGYAVVP